MNLLLTSHLLSAERVSHYSIDFADGQKQPEMDIDRCFFGSLVPLHQLKMGIWRDAQVTLYTRAEQHLVLVSMQARGFVLSHA